MENKKPQISFVGEVINKHCECHGDTFVIVVSMLHPITGQKTILTHSDLFGKIEDITPKIHEDFVTSTAQDFMKTLGAKDVRKLVVAHGDEALKEQRKFMSDRDTSLN